jgi:hypothetical protein
VSVDLEKLTKPFPTSAHKQRQIQGRPFTYVEGHTVIHRLNEATGNTWSMEVKSISTVETAENWKQVTAHVALTIPGLGTREHIGIQDVHVKGADLVKGAITDALKKAATLFGVGLELYGPDYEAGEIAGERGSYKQARGVAPAPPGAPPAEERIRAVRDGTSAVQQVTQPMPPPGNLVTERQRKYLEAVGSEAGWSHNDLHDYALEHFAVPTLTELTRRDASYMIDGLKPPAQGESPKAHYPLEKVARPQANVRPRADPQEANQRAMDVPQEPAWLHDIDQYRA